MVTKTIGYHHLFYQLLRYLILPLQVCLFGSLANALNVAVLTRRDLAVTPINRLLKWLAVADVFVMLEYVPFAIYRYLVSLSYVFYKYITFVLRFYKRFGMEMLKRVVNPGDGDRSQSGRDI